MPHTSSFRIIVITSILIAFAAIGIKANWGSGIGFSQFAGSETAGAQEDFSAKAVVNASQPKVMTPPLNAITSFDAALIGRYVVNFPPPFNADQMTVADVTNSGTITSLDAVYIGHYIVNDGGPVGSTGSTVPPGLLMGDVSGAGPHYDGSPGTPAVSLPTINATTGVVVVPISVGDVTDLGAISYDFQVTFDPAVLQPTSQPTDTTGTLSGDGSWFISRNANNPGHLIISGFSGSNILTGSGTLINLRFNVVGTPGQSTVLIFEDYTDPGSRIHQSFLFNEGTPSVITTNGSVTIVAPTPTSTNTPTNTPTFTPTPTATFTPTPTPTASPCITPGELDTSFNGTGIVITPVRSAQDAATSVAIQTDGRIVTAGLSDGPNLDFALVRYNTDGTLDTSFNGTGKVTTAIGSGLDAASSVAVQADGKIVAVGNSFNGSNYVIALVRYNTDGMLDTSFNGTGIVTTSIGSSYDYLSSVAIQVDGRIVAAGSSDNGSNADFLLVRYNPNGTLDSSFNGTGKVITPIGNSDDYGNSVAIQPDGRIVVTGRISSSSNFDIALVRYDADGTLDTSFNGTGKVITSIGSGDDYGNSVAIQPNGKIVVGGSSDSGTSFDFAVVRYNTDGTLDTTFNGTGKVTTPVGSTTDTASSVAIESDGRIVAAGRTISLNGLSDVALVRYYADGTLDTSFNGIGKVITPVSSGNDAANALALQSDGNIVLAGNSNNGSDDDFLVVRYHGSSPCSLPTTTATNTPTASPTLTPVAVVAVSLPVVTASPGSDITIPITVGDLTGLGVIAYDFQVVFSPAILQPALPAFNEAGTLSSGMIITAITDAPGQLIIGAYTPGTPAIVGSGTLINLKFTVVGTPGQSTSLKFKEFLNPFDQPLPGFMFNEGDPGSTTTNGSVTVLGSAISGIVTYGNIPGPPNPRFVSTVQMNGAGSPPVSALTGSDGSYSLSGFGAGAYTITPSKTGSINGSISSFDAAKIAQHVAGVSVLTGNQFVVADVSGNGTLSSFDAGQLARYVAALTGFGSTGNWIFNPVNRTYPSVVGNITGEDYSALLMGDVSGNWTNTVSRPANIGSGGPERSMAVAAPNLVTTSGKEVIVPISVEGAAGKGIISYEFDLRYDPKVLQPQVTAVDVAGTVSSGLSAVANPNEPGVLRVVVYGALPIDGNGVLLNLRFYAVGAAGSVSPLTWERIMFNEGDPRVTTADGRIEISMR